MFVKKVIVRCPVPKKEELLERLKWPASSNKLGKLGILADIIKNARKYIRNRRGDLEEEKLKILRSKKKIARIKECIKIGEDILKDVMEKEEEEIKAFKRELEKKKREH